MCARRGLLVVVAWLLCGAPAHAVLGEPVASVQGDQIRLQGRRRVTAAPNFAVHEIELPHGAHITQYVTPSGRVFAVAWRSRLKLKLDDLLGTYFAAYVQAMQAPVGRSGMVRAHRVDAADLSVRETGRPGAYAGLAVVRSLVPEGVDHHALR